MVGPNNATTVDLGVSYGSHGATLWRTSANGMNATAKLFASWRHVIGAAQRGIDVGDVDEVLHATMKRCSYQRRGSANNWLGSSIVTSQIQLT